MIKNDQKNKKLRSKNFKKKLKFNLDVLYF